MNYGRGSFGTNFWTLPFTGSLDLRGMYEECVRYLPSWTVGYSIASFIGVVFSAKLNGSTFVNGRCLTFARFTLTWRNHDNDVTLKCKNSDLRTAQVRGQWVQLSDRTSTHVGWFYRAAVEVWVGTAESNESDVARLRNIASISGTC